MGPGDTIVVRARKADGTTYRRWRGTVESVGPDRIVVLNCVGDVVQDIERAWSYRHHTRSIYWFDRPYNLSEVYEIDGRLKQLYVHIASRPRLKNTILEYTDFELDVVRRGHQAPRVVDEDEFEVAAARFGYSPTFRAHCWDAVTQALDLVKSWKARGWTGHTCNATARMKQDR